MESFLTNLSVYRCIIVYLPYICPLNYPVLKAHRPAPLSIWVKHNEQIQNIQVTGSIDSLYFGMVIQPLLGINTMGIQTPTTELIPYKVGLY